MDCLSKHMGFGTLVSTYDISFYVGPDLSPRRGDRGSAKTDEMDTVLVQVSSTSAGTSLSGDQNPWWSTILLSDQSGLGCL